MSESRKTVGFISLGCPKALVDSERILTQLKIDGYDIVPSYDDADVVVVNTCGFIDDAKRESLEAIGEALQENGKVIVTGCMGGDAEQITAIHPQVLSVTGPQAYEEVVGAVHKYVPQSKTHDPFTDLVPAQGIKLTPRHYAYLKISEGCNHRCTFCIIPSLRGDLVSRPVGDVMDEAERLVKAGVQELLIISQDTSAYGVDTRYQTGFWQGRPLKTRMKELCEALSSFGIWVRLHYVYPYPHVDEIIPMMAQGKILPYLDIPFQHASPSVLKAMKRPAHAENTLERIRKWREICPDITLRSTFIVGFPGETEADFQILLDWLEQAQLDRVGCFKYSAVEGATANQLEGAVPEEIKQQRYERFMAVQARISAARLQAKIGSILDVIIDEVDEEGAIGRTAADAPEIDGLVFLNGETELVPGDRVTARIFQADEHDLWAELAHPED
ncbi:MAG: 30S ribosomal protein S12 methylthiotransferase RimO [Pseudomonadales bacterium]|jgi:ribosomal protein S12 methylthiotransferase|uniref:30S ribosomal protein S12 methylthiotransferase RimO n=1 Tax=unclassified Ketobacter TaxID=2639109 RepID=UPI000C4CB743|nr:MULTISPECIES: 30S ribosomal protein S12 methylthiotransferase RimO [unclassified Ketobacter]MAA59791.1 30S ribosomal protein S12 methylthiotransferase RimO [Pseudomonadales bacterium]MEC8810842.1 30S ribosomal protein S12 methylthiotransferase RimO [Pseudomonadota bacterium]HAG93701.1 30S ribosomal protein S12 methylthiotransferase RimO [Gammaproteobacteria bacterium]MAQ26109.1 30S ribosomal protein S12 methylthiotransferase RimO [Pseudomonadales bacterium]MBI26547.1 30S ribosomal protein S|tara:strand:+ start:286 stop:1620 length:1335 start_codon:yes stop_codon:yes gene_type:complete